MKSPILLNLKGKIGLTVGVTQFPSINNECLFLKYDNKLYKISAKSDLPKISRILHILKRPRKLQEILKLLPSYKKKDVIEIVRTLYKLNLITVESIIKNNVPNEIVFNSSNFLQTRAEQRNNGARFNSQIVLIGSGVLANKIMVLLREMNMKCARIKSIPEHYKSTNKKLHELREKNRNSSETPTTVLSSLITSLDKSDLIIVAEDYPNLDLFETVNKICFKKRKAWIRVSFDDNTGYLGPCVVPKNTSCFNCCELRLVTNSPYYEYELWQNQQSIPKTKLVLPEYFADILTTACANEVLRFFTPHKKPETIDSLFMLDTKKMNLTKHKIITHPNCIYCNPPIRRKKRAKYSPTVGSNLRRASMFSQGSNKSSSLLSDNELLEQLRELIDDKTGIIQEYEKLYEPGPLDIYFHHYSTATCSKPLRIGLRGQVTRPVRVEDSLITPSPSGSGFSPREAEIHTLMESVERYSNMVVDESRLIWSSYNKIETNAINPMDLGLYSEKQYDRNDLGCSRFSVDLEIPWIEGYDLYSGKIVLVPADFVYYPAIRKKPLVFDTSNGASAHTYTVQAILNGLFEVIERDSFLIMWLNRVPMPILNLKKLPFGFSESIRRMNQRDLSVKLVDMTSDTGIPAIAAVCYSNNPNAYPALVVGAGSHTDPEKAVQKALFEMEFMLNEMLERPDKKKITHPDKITSMYEHPLFYLNPKMRKYWKFMISSRQTSKIFRSAKRFSKDNFGLLTQIVKILHNMKHRVIYVDITPSDINMLGFKAVKVFVTGLQPLYVGTELRLNFERIRTSHEWLSRNMGVKMEGSELNSAPHPLP